MALGEVKELRFEGHMKYLSFYFKGNGIIGIPFSGLYL